MDYPRKAEKVTEGICRLRVKGGWIVTGGVAFVPDAQVDRGAGEWKLEPIPELPAEVSTSALPSPEVEAPKKKRARKK